jgi:hypothetical protein
MGFSVDDVMSVFFGQSCAFLTIILSLAVYYSPVLGGSGFYPWTQAYTL